MAKKIVACGLQKHHHSKEAPWLPKKGRRCTSPVRRKLLTPPPFIQSEKLVVRPSGPTYLRTFSQPPAGAPNPLNDSRKTSFYTSNAASTPPPASSSFRFLHLAVPSIPILSPPEQQKASASLEECSNGSPPSFTPHFWQNFSPFVAVAAPPRSPPLQLDCSLAEREALSFPPPTCCVRSLDRSVSRGIPGLDCQIALGVIRASCSRRQNAVALCYLADPIFFAAASKSG